MVNPFQFLRGIGKFMKERSPNQSDEGRGDFFFRKRVVHNSQVSYCIGIFINAIRLTKKSGSIQFCKSSLTVREKR